MRCIIVIPSRYGSTRFPGKPLADILGKPMVQHVYERAGESLLSDMVIVATDDARVFDAVASFGGTAVMTSSNHESGTDRIAEAIKDFNYDIVVNLQGDEPLMRGTMIDDCIRLLDDTRASISTLKKRITSETELFDTGVVKVVTDSEGFAHYFSRAPIPYYRDHFGSYAAYSQKSQIPQPPDMVTHNIFVYKHLGIYCYRRDVLLKLSGLPASQLEQAERLEQLRALDNGFRIKAKETNYETIGVDCPEDIGKVEKWLNTYS